MVEELTSLPALPVYLPASIKSLYNGIHSPGEVLRARAAAAQQPNPLRWHTELACDYYLQQTTPMASRGRSKHDQLRRGRTPQINAYVEALHISLITFYLNVRIFTLLQELSKIVTPKTDVTILDRKKFFCVALDAPNPLQALVSFARERKLNPRFRPTDAARLLIVQATPLTLHIKNIQAHLQQEVMPACPDSNFAARMYGSFITELEDHLDLLEQDSKAAKVLAAYDKGYTSELQMATYLGMTRAEIKEILQYLADERKMYRVGEARVKLNQHTDFQWRRVGEPTRVGNIKLRPVSNYDSTGRD